MTAWTLKVIKTLLYSTIRYKTIRTLTTLIDDVAKITLLVKLERQKSLSGGKNDSFLKGDFPLFLPAKQRLRFGIHLGYPYEKKGKDNPSREEQVQYRKEVASYVKNELSNVDGFVLFDEAKRYQVDFPPGW
jgi:hypothetical protein